MSAFLDGLWVPPSARELEERFRGQAAHAKQSIERKLSELKTKHAKDRARLLSDLDRYTLQLNALVERVETLAARPDRPIDEIASTLERSKTFFAHPTEKSTMVEFRKLEHFKSEIVTLQAQIPQRNNNNNNRVLSAVKNVAAFLRLRKRRSQSHRNSAFVQLPSSTQNEITSDAQRKWNNRVNAYLTHIPIAIGEIKRSWSVQMGLDKERLHQEQQAVERQFERRLFEIDGLAVSLSVVLSQYAELLRQQGTKSKSKLKSNTEWPVPFRLDFGQAIAKQFSNYVMNRVPPGPSQCKVGTMVIQPYQHVIPILLNPSSPYPGFLAAFEPGAGKTAMALQAVRLHIREYKTIVVLLPSEVLFSAWDAEMKKWLDHDFSRTLEIKEPNSQLWSLQPKHGSTQKQHYHVLLHKVLVGLSPRMMKKIHAISVREYVLSVDLPPGLSEKDNQQLQVLLKGQANAVLRRRVGLPSNCLVFVDEAQYLTNASDISRSINDSLTVLAWVNCIAQQRKNNEAKSKACLMSGTPNDPESPLPLLKLLNLLFRGQRKPAYSGVWKRALSRDEVQDLTRKALYHSLDHAELQHFRTLYFSETNKRLAKWKPGKETEFQVNYGSLLFFVTLTNDPTRFGQVDRSCKTCSYQWDPERKTVHELSENTTRSLYGIDIPLHKQVRQLFVPMGKTQYAAMKKAMTKDMKRLRSKEEAQVVYGNKENASTVLNSFGTKFYGNEPNPKLDALESLIRSNYEQKQKTFAFSVSMDQRWASGVESFLGKAGYEVLTLSRGFALKRQHGAQWIDQILQSKRKRIILLVASASLTKRFRPEQIHELRTELLTLWNHEGNNNGEYVCGFMGGRNTNTGLSLLRTLNMVLLDVSSNDAMEKQAIARVFRNCGLEPFPVSKWSQMKVWQFVSVPPSSGSSSNKTNEQYQLQALRESRLVSLSDRVWNSILPASGDCELMHAYNGIPQKCISSSQKKQELYNDHDLLIKYLSTQQQRSAIYVASQKTFYDLLTFEATKQISGTIIGQFPSEWTFVDQWIREHVSKGKRTKSKSKSKSKKQSDWGPLLLSLWNTPRSTIKKFQVWGALDEMPPRVRAFVEMFVAARLSVYNGVTSSSSHRQNKGHDEKEYELYKSIQATFREYRKAMERLAALG